jgi:hypothetical protein
MTAAVEEAGVRRVARGSAPARSDRLVSFPRAAARLGLTTETLHNWYKADAVPAIVGPGNRWSTYESWVAAVMVSARPGCAGNVPAITRDWFALHIPEALSA